MVRGKLVRGRLDRGGMDSCRSDSGVLVGLFDRLGGCATHPRYDGVGLWLVTWLGLG